MITFLTDPHIGRNALSHTTADSRQLLRRQIFAQAMACIPKDQPVICLGDVFDKAHNDEATIAEGRAFIDACNLVLAGNHDLTNRANGRSSLELLAEFAAFNDKIIRAPIGGVRCEVVNVQGAQIAFIPHHTSQELFDEAVEAACSIGGRIVCLHCNVDSGFAEGSDAALNLSRDQINQLLEHFNWIAVGHEHIPSDSADDRIKVLGNLHPTSFSDISDKFVWHYDPSNDVWLRRKVWCKATGYERIEFSDLGDALRWPEDVEFIEITGELQGTADVRKLSSFILDLWKQHPRLMMVRNNTTVATLEVQDVDDDDEAGTDNLIDVIDKLVEGSPVQPLWQKYREVHRHD